LHKLGKKVFTSFEKSINNKASGSLTDASKKALEKISFRGNNFKRMVWTGSKGKSTNLA